MSEVIEGEFVEDEPVSENADTLPPAGLTEEEVKRLKGMQRKADFELGRSSQHLRLPDGIPPK